MKIEADNIPYRVLAHKLFNNTIEQKLVPFLGAGVPISDNYHPAHEFPSVNFPDQDKVDTFLNLLQLQPKARLFLEMSIRVGCLISELEKKASSISNSDLIENLKTGDFPPSSSDLSKILTYLAEYKKFKSPLDNLKKKLHQNIIANLEHDQFLQLLELSAKICEIGNINEPLTSIAGYYEALNGRNNLIEELREIIGNKKRATSTHELIAKAAKFYLDQKSVIRDYLIITTNYDCLMEIALESHNVPYVVLFETNNPLITHAWFSKTIDNNEYLKQVNPSRAPGFFILDRNEPMAVVYKIHGCLNPENKTIDSIIISERDYIKFISRMSKENAVVLPSHVKNLLRNQSILFLGYSLRDWNIRSIYEQIRDQLEKRKPDPDYLVINNVSKFEEIYYKDDTNIIVVQTDLKNFTTNIEKHIP